MTLKRYRKMLKLGFRWQRRQKARMRLLRNVKMLPAIEFGGRPRYVNNNRVAVQTYKVLMRRIYQKYPASL